MNIGQVRIVFQRPPCRAFATPVKPRGEIDMYTDRFGCAVTNDTTGEYERVVLECPDGTERDPS